MVKLLSGVIAVKVPDAVVVATHEVSLAMAYWQALTIMSPFATDILPPEPVVVFVLIDVALVVYRVT